MSKERIIDRFRGAGAGPLFICLGGIHGNEPAGVRAIERFFRFFRENGVGASFRGSVLGLRGNLVALEQGVRFLDRDLNRIMIPDIVAEVRSAPRETLTGEYRELRELLDCIDEEVRDTRPEALILLDLHTTSANGGVFSIPADNQVSIDLAMHFYVPIIQGMAGGLEGTSLSYFSPSYQGMLTRVVAFEAGQNEAPGSELRSVAAIWNGLRGVGCLPSNLENPFETELLQAAEGLPRIAELVAVHMLQPGDEFVMRPGYRNFQSIHKGEHLADDRNGPVYAPADGQILMPLYQKQGSNGFFLIRPKQA